MPRRTLRPLKPWETNSDPENQKRKLFDKMVEDKVGNPLVHKDEDEEADWEQYDDPDDPPKDIPSMEDTVDASGKLINQQPLYDHLINAEVQLQRGENYTPGKEISRVVGPDGEQLGMYDINPF